MMYKQVHHKKIDAPIDKNFNFWVTLVDNPGKSIGDHRSSTTVPSVATAIGGDRWATDAPSVGYGVPPEGRRWKVPIGSLP